MPSSHWSYTSATLNLKPRKWMVAFIMFHGLQGSPEKGVGGGFGVVWGPMC